LPREKAQIQASLERKGFRPRSGDHEFLIYYSLDGKKTPVRTKTSHTPKMKDVPDNLLGEMAEQCRVTKRQFLEQVDCPMDQQTYKRNLVAHGAI